MVKLTIVSTPVDLGTYLHSRYDVYFCAIFSIADRHAQQMKREREKV